MASARARHADRDGVGEGASAGIEGSVDGAACISEAEGEVTGGWGEQDPRASTPATAHPMVLIAARLRRRMCPILHASGVGRRVTPAGRRWPTGLPGGWWRGAAAQH